MSYRTASYPLSRKKSTALTTTVELQGTLERNFLRCGIGGRIALFRRVQSVDICLVVLGMVKRHNFFSNIWFKGLLDKNIIENAGKNETQSRHAQTSNLRCKHKAKGVECV